MRRCDQVKIQKLQLIGRDLELRARPADRQTTQVDEERGSASEVSFRLPSLLPYFISRARYNGERAAVPLTFRSL